MLRWITFSHNLSEKCSLLHSEQYEVWGMIRTSIHDVFKPLIVVWKERTMVIVSVLQ